MLSFRASLTFCRVKQNKSVLKVVTNKHMKGIRFFYIWLPESSQTIPFFEGSKELVVVRGQRVIDMSIDANLQKFVD